MTRAEKRKDFDMLVKIEVESFSPHFVACSKHYVEDETITLEYLLERIKVHLERRLSK